MSDDGDDDKPHIYGPYGMQLFEPWNGFGTEAMADTEALYDDLARWSALIRRGDGVSAADEMREVMIKMENSKSPVERLFEGNARFVATESGEAT